MAYAAIVSLKQILEQLRISSHCSNSQIVLLHAKICSLQVILTHNFPLQKTSKNVKFLELQLTDAIWEAENIFELYLSSHFLSCESENPFFSQNLLKVMKEIDSIVESMHKFRDGLVGNMNLFNVVSSTHNPISKNKTAAHDRDLEILVNILRDENKSCLEVVSIVGMCGIGKTTLASSIYNDARVRQHFHVGVWLTLSPEYGSRDISLNLLHNMEVFGHGGYTNTDGFAEESDEKLAAHVCKRLMHSRYLVVLDDLYESQACNYFIKCLPIYPHNGSRIIVTSRILNMRYIFTKVHYHRMLLLDEYESWNLLRKEVFEDGQCPPELVDIGKEIAWNCQGLPLVIVAVGAHLAKAKKGPEYWKIVAERGHSVVAYTDKDTSMSKELSSNYKRLPQHLRACFLYMGVFPQTSEISVQKLINLWIAEGFLELRRFSTLEEEANDNLEELVNRSLVMVRKHNYFGRIKLVPVHSALWHVCSSKAQKHKFFGVMNKCTDTSGTNSQRRLCIYKNVLFGINHLRKSWGSHSTLRSLLCTGPYSTYPLRIYNLDFRLLRVLDALNMRFYKFPTEILKLFQLKYLALTYSGGELPTEVFNLTKIQFLVVRQHTSVKSSGAPSYLATDIWDLKELRHLRFTGNDLPRLPDASVSLLPNLTTLLDVSAYSCTKEIFERIPDLRKLGVRIELRGSVAAAPLCPFDHLVHLQRLKTFKCILVNPDFGTPVVAMPGSSSIFSHSLKKLSLSGCGFPWRDMKKISLLPNLQVLKLLCQAFQGREWERDVGGFQRLTVLLLEDLDLVHWRAAAFSFPRLQRLALLQIGRDPSSIYVYRHTSVH